MKITEAIKFLQDALSEHGDLTLLQIYDDMESNWIINDVEMTIGHKGAWQSLDPELLDKLPDTYVGV